MITFVIFVEKPLNAEQLKAAEMLARGACETDVATACGKSRSWVQKLKKRDDFHQAIADFQEAVREGVRQHAKDNVIEELENFQSRLQIAGRLLYDTSLLFVEKIKARIESLDSEEISPTRIGQNLKQGSDTLLDALEIGKSVLGLDELSQQLNDITKISSNGHESPNGHKYVSNSIERN